MPSLFRQELKRKGFHLTALIYVAGVFFIPRPTYIVVLTAMLAAASITEIFRLRVPAVNDLFFRFFGGIFRDSERDRPSGVLWLLLGVLVAVLVLEPIPLAATALLYIVLGDTAASLVGIGIGGPVWPRSKKTVSGSAACFLVCLAIGTALMPPDYPWGAVVIGAAAATVVEAGFIKINDNFLIPAVSAVVLRITCGLS